MINHLIIYWYRPKTTNDPELNPERLMHSLQPIQKIVRLGILFDIYLRRSWRIVSKFPDIPFCFSFHKSFWYVKKNVSYTPPILIHHLRIYRSQRIRLIRVMTYKNWLMQESPGLNPDWFWVINSFSIKKENKLLYINLPRIFSLIRRSETGL